MESKKEPLMADSDAGKYFMRKAMAGRRVRACQAQQTDQGIPGKEGSAVDVLLDDQAPLMIPKHKD